MNGIGIIYFQGAAAGFEEKNNLADKQPAKVAELRQMPDAWKKDGKAQAPVLTRGPAGTRE